ncbi:hypothetical protein CRUP_035039 [Coryphaenoides rupestris]|nr:hypothetical protein CRUP_035039 [Coryphaenoides rupestris]
MAELWNSWSHLVTTAHTLPVDQVCVPSMPARGQQVSAALQDGEVCAALLSGRVDHLEEVLCRLQEELRKEQEEKRLLQEEVLLLRQDNLRLQPGES